MLARYQQMEVTTASPVLIVVKLYEGALRRVQTASAAIASGDVHLKAESIRKAIAIVTELRCGLDLEQGREIAANLDGLYGFVLDRLVEGNVNNDGAALGEAERVLGILLEAWSELSQRPEASVGR